MPHRTQLQPHLPGPIDAIVRVMDPPDLLPQTLFPDNTVRHRTGPGLVIGGRCDLHPMLGEHATDRLDTEHLFVTIDVINDLGYRRSSSAAKKTDADLRISFARIAPSPPPATAAT
jgi:hypothetical protein